MSNRFYLCNLIPLWMIDDEALDADWTSEDSREGELIKLRVVVTGEKLDPEHQNFFVRFEIFEDDFLLSGWTDDLTAVIDSRAPKDGEPLEQQREIRIIPADADVPSGQELSAIWVSPGEESGLIRAYWKVQHIDDVSGDPEFYFDVEVGLIEREAKERATRLLKVGPALNLPAESEKRYFGPPAYVKAAGWTKSSAKLGEEVGMAALVADWEPGQTVRFEVLDTQTASEVIEQIDIPLSDTAQIVAPFTLPQPLPDNARGALRFRCYIQDDGKSATASLNHAKETVTPEEVFEALEPLVDMEIALTDESGGPLQYQYYELLDTAGQPVLGDDGKPITGSAGAGGIVLIPKRGLDEVMLYLPQVTILDVSEPERQLPPPETDNLVLTIADARLYMPE